MNKCIFQLWEESSREGLILQDGCSIHLNEYERNIFIRSVYSSRNPEVPNTYERIVGSEIEAFVSDILFEKLKSNRNIRISETEKNNLISLEEILFKPSI